MSRTKLFIEGFALIYKDDRFYGEMVIVDTVFMEESVAEVLKEKGNDPNELLIVKVKLALYTGRVLDFQIYNPVNREWSEPLEPTQRIIDLFEEEICAEVLLSARRQEICKRRLAKRANKRQ